MALFRKLFYRKPPDGLLEISERVFVFDCCFATDAWGEVNYKGYIGGIIGQLRDHFPDPSFLVFNFREGNSESKMADCLSEYDMTIMDYPRQYEGCPLLPMELLHHFLRSSESWLSLGPNNVLLMHCERGGWPVLAFVLASLLLYRKQYTGEHKTLDMVYKQAPAELLQFLSPLNPIPSQLRYLQYVSRRNLASEWPPLDRALTLDCVMIRSVPNFDGGGCRPVFKIYGQDVFVVSDRTPRSLYSTLKKIKHIRHYKQAECELVKIDINCHIQGDVVLECINLHSDMEREEMMFRVMFNTAFIRSNILILNRDEIDVLWNAKEQFPKDFRAEVLFSEMDAAASVIPTDWSSFNEKDGLPVEAFAKVQEIFSSVDWMDPKADAALNVLQHIYLESGSPRGKGKDKFSEASPGKHLEKEEFTMLEDSCENGLPLTVMDRPIPSMNISCDAEVADSKTQSQDLRTSLKEARQYDEMARQMPQSSESNQISNCQSVPPAIGHIFSDQRTPPEPPTQLQTLSVNSETKSHLETQKPCFLSSICPESSNNSSTNEYEAYIEVTHQSALAGSMLKLKPIPINSEETLPKCDTSHPITSVSPLAIPPMLKDPPTPSPPPPPPPPVPPTSSTLLLKGTFASGSQPPPPPSPSAQLIQVGRPTRSSSISSSHPPFAAPNSSYEKNPSSVQTSGQTSVKSLSSNSVLVHLPSESPPPVLSLRPSPLAPPSLSPPQTSVPPPPATRPPPPPPPPPSMRPSQTSPSHPSIRPLLTSTPPAPPRSSLPRPPTQASPPPPPPLPSTPPLRETASVRAGPPPPPPLPVSKVEPGNSIRASPAPPPPPLAPTSSTKSNPPPPSVPPPPLAAGKGTSKGGVSCSNIPGPPVGNPSSGKGRTLSRTISSKNNTKKLKPLHWLKISRAVQGSLWAEAQKSDEASKAPEIDISELENLFSAAVPNSDQNRSGGKSRIGASAPKSDRVQLVDHRRAYNCEIMLSKVKVPLHELMNSVLALEDSALDIDQVDNLIKFCPTKEEMEQLKGYTGDKEKLGKCEQFFLVLMQVPRVESKLRVFSFKLQFRTQVCDLRNGLNIVNSAAEEIRNSAKLKRIMQTILSLGNALNQGTARGSAIGFRLDSLLKLTETRARNNKITLMHYLCKVLADKLPEVLDFSKDLANLERASKVQLKYLAEEMQAISKGLEKVVQELSLSENDGPVSEKFHKILKEFLSFAEAEVRTLTSLYSGVGRNVDALILYFGEDPAKCPFEQVVSTLHNFVRMFNRAQEENTKQLEMEKKKAEKESEAEKVKMGTRNDSGKHMHTPVK